ncbi:hypothetical protein BZA05DRAFT_10924 [Tricharina praecox]|uniref:uncharacterized protein n=1 Tax=Tricharina praecox TaxID=43433 RepID=UPI00221F734F|nr:uncharacterized protein BZA05DRAFT_10924 [Tricharina praecox]KAI5858691.1 hypothetical protein BZA05DRAFT_10924 [Tricharina praecox]
MGLLPADTTKDQRPTTKANAPPPLYSHCTAVHCSALHSTPLHSTPLHSTPLHSTPLRSLSPHISPTLREDTETQNKYLPQGVQRERVQVPLPGTKSQERELEVQSRAIRNTAVIAFFFFFFHFFLSGRKLQDARCHFQPAMQLGGKPCNAGAGRAGMELPEQAGSGIDILRERRRGAGGVDLTEWISRRESLGGGEGRGLETRGTSGFRRAAVGRIGRGFAHVMSCLAGRKERRKEKKRRDVRGNSNNNDNSNRHGRW